MDFGNLFTRSWNIVWGNKWMIVLGFLAALTSGGSSSSNFNFSGDGSEFANIDPGIFENSAEAVAAASAIVLGVICFAFILGIVLWLIGLTAQAGMIESAVRLDAGEKLGFMQAMRIGWGYLGRLVGLNLIVFLIFFIPMMIIIFIMFAFGGATAFAAMGEGGSGTEALLGGLGMTMFFVFCCMMCIIMIASLLLGVLMPFATRAIVLEEYGVVASLRRGWDVIRNNVGNVAVLIIAYIVVGVLIAVVLGIVLVPVGLLAGGPTIYTLASGGSIGALEVITAGVGLLFIVLVSAAINAVWIAFRSTATTLAYQEFTSKKMLADV